MVNEKIHETCLSLMEKVGLWLQLLEKVQRSVQSSFDFSLQLDIYAIASLIYKRA